MKYDYEIVKYQPDFKKDVVELQKYLWSPDPELNTAYFEWKHECNPYLQPPLLYLALSGKKVVGMRSMFGVQWEFGVPAKTVSGIYPDDLVIAPDHRNRGLITKMMRAAFDDLEKEGYQYVYNLSAGAITRLASLAMGWRSAGSMRSQHRYSRRAAYFQRIRNIVGKTRLIRNIDGKKRLIWRYADELLYRRWRETHLPLHEPGHPQEMRPGKIGSRIAVEQRVRAGEMAKLLSKIEYDGRIRHVRDKDYLSWRFRNPLHRYLFLYWEEKDLEGYLVLQQGVSQFSWSKGRVNIVDWEATSLRVRAELLRGAINFSPFVDLNIWTSTIGVETKNLLRDVGFQPVQKGAGVDQEEPCLLVRSIRADVPEAEWSLGNRRLLDMANWDIRMIYSMRG
jgi:GNAT superfamily N-acetyltransferase